MGLSLMGLCWTLRKFLKLFLHLLASLLVFLACLFQSGTEAIFINICQFVVAFIDISGFSCIDVSVHVFPSLGIVIACLAFLKFMWVAIQLYIPG